MQCFYTYTQFLLYLVAFACIIIVCNALPRPNIEDLLTSPPPSTQEQSVENTSKSALVQLRDCLKGGQFDIAKGCHPQRVEKYTITIVNEPQPQTDLLFAGPSASLADDRRISEIFDRLTDDVLLL